MLWLSAPSVLQQKGTYSQEVVLTRLLFLDMCPSWPKCCFVWFAGFFFFLAWKGLEITDSSKNTVVRA